MKCLIPNSGQGTRMGEMTKTHPKAIIDLGGEGLLERQIRIVGSFGVSEFVITTGPFADQIESMCREKFPDYTFTFVPNEKYAETNFMYSLALTREFIDDSFIYFHGDMVFPEELIGKLVDSEHKNCVLMNDGQELWEKDGKGRIKDGKLWEISTAIFGDDCANLNQVYKLSKEFILNWMDEMDKLLNSGELKMSANVAMTNLFQSGRQELFPVFHQNDVITEIDVPEDLEKWKASKE